MGQYWQISNLDKKEYIDNFKLGSGCKLWEQLANELPSKALLVLLANMPESRGGGDLNDNEVIGRWAGDRIVIVGDYAEAGDLPSWDGDITKVYNNDEYKDVSHLVLPVLEAELEGQIVTDEHGYSLWRYDRDEKEAA